MSNRRLPLAVLALIVIVALISACGSTTPAGTGTGTGSSGGSNAPAGSDSSSGGTTASKREKAVKFAKCMRSNGVSEFPDPGASGDSTIDGIVNGSSLDPDTPAFEQAMRACKSLEPAGFTGSKRSPQQMQAALAFAQCIRENGVKDFPDPANGQPLVDTNRIPSSEQPGGMSILNAAMQKCRDLSAAARGQQ